MISFAIPGTLILIKLRIVRCVIPSSRFHTRLRTVALFCLLHTKSLQEDLKDYIGGDDGIGQARYYHFSCLLKVLPSLRDLAWDVSCGFGSLSDEKDDLGS